MSALHRETAIASLQELFTDPPAAFRGKPFWAWNGRLDREELLRQARVFRDMGMGGFFMHARTGLSTEYLGSDWCNLVNDCADEAEKLGLEAWLYDEDRWPSGSAGGLATKEERFRSKVLRMRIADPKKVRWPPPERFVAAFAARIDGLEFTECTPIEQGARPAQDGRQVLIFSTEMWTGQSFYNGGTYLDTLSREATEQFIAVTHGRYLERCHGRLGRSIRGIFTDEPHHGTVMCENFENRAMEDQRCTTPWTETLWDAFQAAWGYDLRGHLPELFLFPEGRRVSQVKWHYMELLQRMFLENWARPVHEWCQAHQLQLTGHLLHEDSLVAQAVPCGSVMRAYEFLDMPGIDVPGLDNRPYWIVKQLASAGRQLGKKWLLSELYGGAGWQLDFAGHKRIGSWQALLGVNVRCHHLAWFTMAGEAKRDHPASIGFQSAWCQEYRAVEDFFSRLHVLLSQGDRVCDILVLNPVESTWAQIHPGWAEWLGALDPALKKLEQTYCEVFSWLTAAQIDFDYADEEHLARLGSVSATDDGIRLRVGAAGYRTVVVAGAITVRSTTLELLEDFVIKGGTVIFAGETPPFVDAEPSERAALLASQCTKIPHSARMLVGAVFDPSSPLQIEADDSARTKLLCQLRRDGERWIVALLNLSSSKSIGPLTLLLTAKGCVEEWHCDDGGCSAIVTESSDGGLRWSTDLAPGQLRVFVVSSEFSPHAVREMEFDLAAEALLGTDFAYELSEPNVCVLDKAECQFSKGAWEPAREILELDSALRARFGWEQRSETMVQPWAFQEAYEETSRVQRLSLRFRFACAAVPETPVDLLIESPGTFSVSLNGTAVKVSEDTQWHIDPSLRRVPLPATALVLGPNELVLQCLCTEGTNLEAIYLLGNFGVTLDDGTPWLGELPPTLHVGDAVNQSLPFYSGCITYRMPVPAMPPGYRAARLELGAFNGAVARVRAANGESRVIAWPPNSADVTLLIQEEGELLLDVILTRRNTFGPLHLTPLDQPFIGPASFRSEGDAFTNDYILHPSGLLEEPRIVFSP